LVNSLLYAVVDGFCKTECENHELNMLLQFLPDSKDDDPATRIPARWFKCLSVLKLMPTSFRLTHDALKINTSQHSLDTVSKEYPILCIPADKCISFQKTPGSDASWPWHVFYHDVDLQDISNTIEQAAGIALVEEGFPKDLKSQFGDQFHFPGWADDYLSISYHSDNGSKFYSSDEGENYTGPCKAKDVIGLLYDMKNNTMHFTCNGTDLGLAYDNIPTKIWKPMIGTVGAGVSITYNFGHKPFVFDLTSWVTKQNNNGNERRDNDKKNYGEL